MNLNEVTIGRFKNEDFAVYKQAYNESFILDLNEKLFYHLHQRNIQRFSVPLIYVATIPNGRIIGAISYFFDEVSFHNTLLPVAQIGAAMVVPEFRRRSIFMSILDFAHNDLKQLGISAVFGFANDNAVKAYLNQGFNCISQTVDVVIQTNGLDFLKNQLIRALKAFSFSLNEKNRNLTVKTVKQSNLGSVTNLIGANGIGPGDARILKSPEYLVSKYGNHPINTYKQYIIEPPEGGRAFFIVRADRYKRLLRWGQIVEAGCEPNCDLGEAFTELAHCLVNDGFIAISYWAAATTVESIKCSAQVKSEKPIYFVVKDLSATAHLATAKWDYFCGDADTA